MRLGLAIVFCLSLPAAELRTVWPDANVSLVGAPSPDGRYLSFVHPGGDLAIRDIKTGQVTKLTKKEAGSKEYAYFSVFSRDSKRVAFAWHNNLGFYDLRVINVDGSGERVLYRNEEAGFVQPCAFSPDDREVLTLLFRSDNISQIVMVSTAGGQPKIIRSLNWVYPKRMDLSPDGRFIAYDSFAKPGGGDRTLFLLSTSGDEERKLRNEPDNHLFPLFTPDGKSIVYITEREGKVNVSQLEIGAGTSRLLADDVGRALPMGITNSGDYYLGVRSGEVDVFVTSLAAPTAKPLRATIKYPGRNLMPAFSRDGKWLAYLSRIGIENFGEAARGIAIRSMEEDSERLLQPKLALIERIVWSPDAKSLLVIGTDGKGRGGAFLVDAQTGDLRTAVTGSTRGIPAIWSNDGNVIHIHEGSEVRAGDTTLFRGSGLRQLAISPSGQWLAIAAEQVIHLVRIAGGESRNIPLAGATQLDWARDLIAEVGPDLFRITLDGTPSVKMEMPGNRVPGFSVHPDGERIAIAAGKTRSEVKVLKLPTTISVPAGLDAYLPVPPENPLTRDKVELGRNLFFDKRLSRDNSMSCATCHDPAYGFTDARKIALGGGDRRVPRIINRAYGTSFFWDGRSPSLEDQVVQPIHNPKEMNLPLDEAAARTGISVQDMRFALACYVRTILSGNAPVDRYLLGDKSSLNDQQIAGLKLFRGKAGCTACHLGPNFTDERLHNTGIGSGSFKTPSLREAARTPPYMHDGSLPTMDDVIDFYDKGGKPHPDLDPDIRKLNLTAQEKASLKSFLEALNGTVRDGL